MQMKVKVHLSDIHLTAGNFMTAKQYVPISEYAFLSNTPLITGEYGGNPSGFQKMDKIHGMKWKSDTTATCSG